MNTLTAEEAQHLAARIRSRRWGWKQAFNAWHLVNGDSPNFIIDNGVRHLRWEPAEFIKTNLANLPALGLADIVQPDGTLQLDSAGEYRYEPLGEVGLGFTAYQRITEEQT